VLDQAGNDGHVGNVEAVGGERLHRHTDLGGGHKRHTHPLDQGEVVGQLNAHSDLQEISSQSETSHMTKL
jgi:hypothetical protein